MHNEAKVNTNNDEFAHQVLKNLTQPGAVFVGSIQTPYGYQLITQGDAVDHASMRGAQLKGLLLLMMGDDNERFTTLGQDHQHSLLWLATQLAGEVADMVEILVADLNRGKA